MLNGKRIAVVLPAYNAVKTLHATVTEIPDLVDYRVLMDDHRTDYRSGGWVGFVCLAPRAGSLVSTTTRLKAPLLTTDSATRKVIHYKPQGLPQSRSLDL